MLTKRRCSATGAINFFSRHEPYIAIGTVVARFEPAQYIWRYHGETLTAGGTVYDWRDAEKAIQEHHHLARQNERDRRCAA